MKNKILMVAFIFSCWACLSDGQSQVAVDYRSPVSVRAEVLLEGLRDPWAVVSAPDGGLYITEARGQIYKYGQGQLSQPLRRVPRVTHSGQGGLLDFVFHPQFDHNKWIYLSYSVGPFHNMRTRVTRFTLDDDELKNPVILVEGGKGSDGAHFGSRLVFGKDGKLYVTIGERHQKELAQHLGYLNGKVLRLNDDGTVPNDNPFVGVRGARPEIYSYGHRNPQGIDVHPVSGLIFITEHGPTGYDAPGGGDEINVIEKGGNYGWPVIHHQLTHPDMKSPLVEYTPAVAPSGASFYLGDIIPEWENDFLFATLRGAALYRLKIDGKNVVEHEVLFEGEFGRLRDVASGKDGYLYVISEGGELIRIGPTAAS
ncbi:MAG: PQQ-dependent sugar dehydrogenase [Candidatus Binatia bacterium]